MLLGEAASLHYRINYVASHPAPGFSQAFCLRTSPRLTSSMFVITPSLLSSFPESC